MKRKENIEAGGELFHDLGLTGRHTDDFRGALRGNSLLRKFSHVGAMVVGGDAFSRAGVQPARTPRRFD